MTDQTEYMTESDEPTDETPDETASEGVAEQSFGLFAERQCGAISNHFASEEALLAYIESGRELSDLEGIGRVTESRVLQYISREHPEAYETYEKRHDYVLFDGDVYTPGAGPAAGTPPRH